MSNLNQIYDPKNDPMFQKPYVDQEEWRDTPCRHLYVHGGFEGTGLRFVAFFPPKEQYKQRFFQHLSPVQGDEHAVMELTGAMDRISFSVTHGAYCLESNMGGDNPVGNYSYDPSIIYKSNAAVAQYSRVLAEKYYGPHFANGFVYGGSGGAYKTFGAFESTRGVWQGAAPYVNGHLWSIPGGFMARAHALRVLRHKMDDIIAANEPGGSGDMYATLNEEEAATLREFTAMGFPPESWWMLKQAGTGSLPVLSGVVYQADGNYLTDFWTVPGYLGADPNGSAVRDRFRYESSIAEIIPSDSPVMQEGFKTGTDEAWRSRFVSSGMPGLRFADDCCDEPYLEGVQLQILSGALEGEALPIGSFRDGILCPGGAFSSLELAERVKLLQPGDRVRIDNSDAIAIQTYYRHALPPAGQGYVGYDQFRDADGTPLYPQRPVNVSPMLAAAATGRNQSGEFEGKMIQLGSIEDPDSWAWNQNWYRQLAVSAQGPEVLDRMRIYYTQHSAHGDVDDFQDNRILSYLGTRHQALLDLCRWVEEGIEPPANTEFTIENARVVLPDSAAARKGIQPVVQLTANGQKVLTVKLGESVHFEGSAELPPEVGSFTEARWCFDAPHGFPTEGELHIAADGLHATVSAEYSFASAGNYYPALRVASERNGNKEDIFTQVYGMDRICVHVV